MVNDNTMKHGSELLRALTTPQAKQVEVAQRLGVSQQAVSAWMSGVSRPSYERKRKLQELYGIPVDSWDEESGDAPSGGEAA